jgi:hypothetical protein
MHVVDETGGAKPLASKSEMSTNMTVKKSSIDGNCYLVYLWSLLVYKIVVLVVS